MDRDKTGTLAERIVTDVGGAFIVALAYIGDRLGLFRALAEGPSNSEDLAARLSLDERYVREWLKAMVAAEYAEFDGRCYSMTAEQVAVLADEESEIFGAGAFQVAMPSLCHVPRVLDAFRNGGGFPYGEMGTEVAQGIDRLHRPAFEHHLVQKWLANVPDLPARLESGARVLDVGCGLGRSTRVLARAYPASHVTGLDPDAWSLGRARELSRDLENVDYFLGTLAEMSGDHRYDLVLAIDCIHDMQDPVGVLGQIRGSLSDDGRFLWIEPTGSSDPRENREPIHRMRAGISPLHCLTVSLAAGGPGLGTIIGEDGARRLAGEAGFSRFEKLPIENATQQFFLLR